MSSMVIYCSCNCLLKKKKLTPENFYGVKASIISLAKFGVLVGGQGSVQTNKTSLSDSYSQGGLEKRQQLQ